MRPAIAALILIAACSSTPEGESEPPVPAPTTEHAKQVGEPGVVSCESVLAGPPQDGTTCVYDSDTTGTINVLLSNPCPNDGKQYHLVDDTSDGTWFGVDDGQWELITVDDFTTDFVWEACSQ